MRKSLNHVLIFFLLAFLAVSVRLFYLQVIKYDFLKALVMKQLQRIVMLPAERGDIYDSSGNILATSIDTYSIGVHARIIKDKGRVSDALSSILKINRSLVSRKLLSNKTFVWIERKVPKETWFRIRALTLEGVTGDLETDRVYTKGRLASQVLGFVGTDNNGLSGIELGFDDDLRGVDGKQVTESDIFGRELVSANPIVLMPPVEGRSVTLTIDEVVQYFAEKYLEEDVKKHGASSGTAIVMDVNSGYILAMASMPDFNPNNYSSFPALKWNAKGVTDTYEPGSTFKLVTAAAGLEDGVVTLNERFYCPDHVVVGGRVINNSHMLSEKEKNCDLSEILQHSINTGIYQISEKLGEQKFYDYIRAFGFGKRTRIGIPGETAGMLRDVSDWAKPDIAMMSFGQAIGVTPLQMLSAVSTMANDGVRMKPILVKKVESLDGSFVKVYPPEELGRVLSPKVSSEMRDLMVDVVEKGTGLHAKIKGFWIGGKTGTAEKAKPGGHGYWSGHFVSSFVGIAPATRPKIAIIVVIDDPKGQPWGESVAAPTFAKIAEDTLRYLNVAPDDLKAEAKKP